MKVRLSVIIIVITFFSCKVQQKMPLYLQGINNENIEKQINVPELKIQKNDLLAIQVYSDYLPKSDNPDVLYNQPTPTGGNSGGISSGNTTLVNGGYLVDRDGNITYPRSGSIHAEGLTKEQLSDEIKRRLLSPVVLLKNPTVIIRFQSYKIITVGEFAAPQVLNIPTEKINIFEAISMSGGITEWGRKDLIKVIREQDGHREVGIVDLSSPNVFSSPYFFLKQNDILVIDPIKEKARQRDEQTTITKVSIGTALLSVALSIYYLARSFK